MRGWGCKRATCYLSVNSRIVREMMGETHAILFVYFIIQQIILYPKCKLRVEWVKMGLKRWVLGMNIQVGME